VYESRKEIESDIAQLQEFRERAIEGGDIHWVQHIDIEIAKKQQQLKELENEH
jgi:hypothetical protein